MFSKLICVISCLIIIFSKGTEAAIVPHSDCGSYWKMYNVTVEDCIVENNRCILYGGQNITLSFTFNSGYIDIDTNLINEVAIVIRGYWFPEPVDPPQPCDVLKCPIEQNYVEYYSVKMHIPDSYYVVLSNIEWKITTSEREQLLCFQIPISIF